MRIQPREVLWARVRRLFWLLRHLPPWSSYCALDAWDSDGRVILVAATERSLRDRRPVEGSEDRIFWSKA